MAETIEIDGTEVIVEETDDGFTAEEVEAEEVFAIKATDKHEESPHGFIIPLSKADQFEVEKGAGDSYNPHNVAWNTEADVSDMRSSGATVAKKDS